MDRSFVSKHLSNDLPIYTIERRQWIDKMARQSQDGETRSLQMIGWLMILGFLLTGILLVAVYTNPPKPTVVVEAQ